VFDRLDKMLGLVRADYADLRYELARATSIDFSGRELTGLSASSTDGFVWRVLKNGGWSQVSFTKPEDAERAARSAVENADLLARGGARPVRLAPVPPARDEVHPGLNEDPRLRRNWTCCASTTILRSTIPEWRQLRQPIGT